MNEKRVLEQAVQIANRLTVRWARTASGESTLLSGVGIWPLLAFLADGASESVQSELEVATGLPAIEAAEHARALLTALAGSRTLEMAVGVWTPADLRLEEGWARKISKAFRGVLTGDPATDQAALDAWVRERTRGLVEGMPGEVGAGTLMLLASALSVRTAWAEPFEDHSWHVPDGPWSGDTRIAGLRRTTSHLDEVSVAATAEGPVTLQTVRGTEDVDLHLLLGEPYRWAGDVLAAGITALSPEYPKVSGPLLHDGKAGPGVWVEHVPSWTTTPALHVITVRFQIDARHDLLQHSELFGMKTATTPTADPRGHFPGISSVPLMISQAVQCGTATFSAKGFEAAVVTALYGRLGSAYRPPTCHQRSVSVCFDRPFGYAAVHRPTGLVLVAGWVAEPERSG